MPFSLIRQHSSVKLPYMACHSVLVAVPLRHSMRSRRWARDKSNACLAVKKKICQMASRFWDCVSLHPAPAVMWWRWCGGMHRAHRTSMYDESGVHILWQNNNHNLSSASFMSAWLLHCHGIWHVTCEMVLQKERKTAVRWNIPIQRRTAFIIFCLLTFSILSVTHLARLWLWITHSCLVAVLPPEGQTLFYGLTWQV